MPVPCPVAVCMCFNVSYRLALGVIILLSFASLGQASWLDILRPKPTERLEVKVEIAGEVKAIGVDVFLPSGQQRTATKQPAVILLHGVEGAKRYEAAHYQTAARLTREGYAVFFVHYFDSVPYDDLWVFDTDKKLDTKAIEVRCVQDCQKWRQAIVGAVQEVARRDDIDRAALAINGYSLGGFLALATTSACRDEKYGPQIKAAVVNWGAKFADTKLEAGFPPTFFVHGECDAIVPLSQAKAVVARLQEVKSETSLHVIAEGGHTAFTPESFALTRNFLRKHLVQQSTDRPRQALPALTPAFSLAP